MEWKWSKQVSKAQIEEVEKKLNFKFPLDFIEDVLIYNGGRPESKTFLLSNGIEIVFNNLLSFNEEKGEYIVSYNNFESKHKESFIAIALDPFGNYIGYDKSSNKLMFLNHETDNLTYISNTWLELKGLLEKGLYIKKIEEKFEIDIDGQLRTLLYFCKNEPIFFDIEKKLLSIDEILNSKEELQLTKDIIPLIDLYDNDFLGYDVLNKEFVKFNISTDDVYIKLDSIQIYIDMLNKK